MSRAACGCFAKACNCENSDRVTDKCPTPNDPIETYFSRSDVQAAIHIPNFGNWSECSNRNVFVNGQVGPFCLVAFHLR